MLSGNKKRIILALLMIFLPFDLYRYFDLRHADHYKVYNL